MSYTHFARTGFASLLIAAACLLAFTAPSHATPTIDQTFGGPGGVTPKLFAKSKKLQVARGVTIQTSGKVVFPLALETSLGHLDRRPLIRVNADGSRDQSFGKGGTAWIRIPGKRYVTLYGVEAIASDQLIVWGGYASHSRKAIWDGPDALFVARLNADGALDPTFADGGIRKLGPSAIVREARRSLELQSDGSAYLLQSGYFGYSRFTITKLDAAGNVDSAFGPNGTRSVKLDGNTGAVDATVAGGSLYTLTISYRALRCTVSKYRLPSRTLDTTFGTGGRASVNVDSAPAGYCNSILARANGALVITADRESAMDPPGAFAFQLTPTGVPDAGFGINGVAGVALLYELQGLVELSDGTLVGAGFMHGNESRSALVALDATGVPSPAFGNNGFVKLGRSIEGFKAATRGSTAILALDYFVDDGFRMRTQALRITG